MKLIYLEDRVISQFQTNVREVLDTWTNNPLSGGKLLSNVAIKTGVTNIIPIGLSQPLVGWYVTRLNANSIIWDSQDLNTTPSQNLQLLCSTDCTVSLYIF